MPCLPNATLSNYGNVPGITLWVKKNAALYDFYQKLSFRAQ